MIELARNKISNVTVTLTVEENIGSQLGGYPILTVGDVLCQSKMVAEVDTLAVIKAIHTCKTAGEFADYLEKEDIYNAEFIGNLVKSFAFESICQGDVDGGVIVESEYNNHLVKQIDVLANLIKDGCSPKTEMMARAKMFDLHQKLEVI